MRSRESKVKYKIIITYNILTLLTNDRAISVLGYYLRARLGTYLNFCKLLMAQDGGKGWQRQT
jgi:hypothetical protein